MAAAGNSFALIEPGAVSGTFTGTNFPAVPAGQAFTVSYAAAPTGVVALLSSTAGFSAAPNPLAFGNQPEGVASAPMTLTFSNPGTTTLSITGGLTPTGGNAADFALVAGAGTCGPLPINVNPNNASCTVQYTFTPTAIPVGNEMTTLQVTDNATGSPQTVTLTGTGTQPVVSGLPASESFGTVPIGTPSATVTVTLMNTGNGALIFSAAPNVTGPNMTDFAITGDTCTHSGMSVAAGGNCAVTLVFTPTATPAAGATTAAESATLNFADNASPAMQTVSLSGTGTLPVVTFTPTAAVGVNFGAVVPGMTSAAMTVTLAVTAGTGNLQLSSVQAISTSDTSDFAIVGQTTTCPTDGGMVAAGTSCVVTLTYTASFAGTENGMLRFTGTNLVGSPVNIPLTGVGASTAAGFTLTGQSTNGSNGTTITLLPGDIGTFTIIVQPNPGFIGMISLMCVSGIPATIATANPATINVTMTPSPPITVTCTLQTNCNPSLVAPKPPRNAPPWTAPPVGAVLLLAMLLAMRRRRSSGGGRGFVRQLMPALGMVLLVLLVMTWTACVSNAPPAIPGAPTTPAGVYQIQLVGTAAGGVKTTLTLTVHMI